MQVHRKWGGGVSGSGVTGRSGGRGGLVGGRVVRVLKIVHSGSGGVGIAQPSGCGEWMGFSNPRTVL